MKYNKIVLIGMMGCGKSTISSALAQKLNFKLFESDEIFEQQNKIKIKDYFKEFGEESFRKKESEILFNLLKSENFVLSTGGGIILSQKNREMLFNDEILTIYLKASEKTVFERLKNDKTRPLLQVSNPQEEIKKIILERKKYYNLAKFTIVVDNKKIDEITEEILDKLWIK